MELKETKINIGSKVFREAYRLKWCIENFDMMPFCDDHPVCGPCFLLGEHRDTTWTMLMSKQMHKGVENVGFRFIRADDDTNWNMVTVSLSVMLEDGRLVKCVDKEVLVGETEYRFVFLIQPSKSKRISFKNGMDASTQVENSRGLKGSFKASKFETFSDIDGEVKNGVKEAISIVKPVEINLSPKVENSHDLDESTVPKNEYFSFEDAELKKSDEQEDTIAMPNAVNGSSKVENIRNVESGEHEEYITKSKKLKIESGRIKDPRVKTSEVQQDDVEFTPEDLLKQKNLTVVCVIEYTYMMCINIEKNEKGSVESDLMDVFKYLHATGKFSDVTVKCDGIHFMCHKAILCPRSRVIGDLLQSGSLPSEVTVNLNMQLHITKAFLLYLYTGELPDGISADDCRLLCKVAEIFSVQGMKRSCLELMKSLEYEECCLVEVDVRLDKTSQSLISVVSSPTQSLMGAGIDTSIKLTRLPILDIVNSCTQTSQ